MNKTKDLMFAGFLKVNGHQIIDFVKLDAQRHTAEYIFDIDDPTWKQLKLDFDKSTVSAVKWACEAIKDLSY